MTQEPEDQELVNLREMLISNSIQKDAIIQILIQKGVFTQEEFNEKLKELQSEYSK